jgi:hypothetical protein
MQPNLQQAKQAAVQKLLRSDSPGNVVAIGIGNKLVKGRPTATDCVRVYVVSKLDPEQVRPAALVPPHFNRVPTDVIEIGLLGRKGRQPWEPWTKPAATTGTKPFPPPMPGSRIRVETHAPNVNSGAIGTLGAVVQDGAGEQYILSCNHILAANGRVTRDPAAKVVAAAFVGKETPLAGPVVYFVGDDKKIASPVVYVPLTRHGHNLVDCALAQINKRTNLPAKFPRSIRPLNPDPIEPDIHMKVQKFGAATGVSSGTIVDVHADLYVDTSFGRFRFNDQIVIEARKDPEFATEGDSGSIVWDEKTKQPVAMVFAASGKYAIACRLSEVVSRLKKELEKKQRGDPKLKLQGRNPGKVELSLLIK